VAVAVETVGVAAFGDLGATAGVAAAFGDTLATGLAAEVVVTAALGVVGLVVAAGFVVGVVVVVVAATFGLGGSNNRDFWFRLGVRASDIEKKSKKIHRVAFATNFNPPSRFVHAPSLFANFFGRSSLFLVSQLPD